MTVTTEFASRTAPAEDRPHEAPQKRAVPSQALEELVALLAQGYVFMPLFP